MTGVQTCALPIWFLALLHARKASWIAGKGLAIGTILGFFLLLMTYYGVSFYLVGLHSYAGGHAKPIPPLLIGYVIAECLFLFFVSLQRNRRGSEEVKAVGSGRIRRSGC